MGLVQEKGYWRGSFEAMASPCELLMEVDSREQAAAVLEAVSAEALRIEHKFSRYRNANIIHRINHAAGAAIEVDDETARLLDFADELYRLSDGLFDITSGVLRRVWNFDGGDNLPTPDQVDDVLGYVGWDKVDWRDGCITLQSGMEIDLGGIGKEYAVDQCVAIARQMTVASVLVNFGGDLAVTCPRDEGQHWSVGRMITGREDAVALFRLRRGAIATSGDAHRFLLKDGVRYSHVLDPRTGWPVADAPHTVSVAAPTCIEAGMYSTLAMLHGADAEEFLGLQEVDYWID